jgi:predicted Rossmann-fold nucleotide-binding protein
MEEEQAVSAAAVLQCMSRIEESIAADKSGPPGEPGKTLDELFEALTLIQTGKIKDFPVILFGREFHRELVDHIEKMRQLKTISESDLQLFLVTDSIDEAVDRIRQVINQYGLKPTERQPSWLLGERR